MGNNKTKLIVGASILFFIFTILNVSIMLIVTKSANHSLNQKVNQSNISQNTNAANNQIKMPNANQKGTGQPIPKVKVQNNGGKPAPDGKSGSFMRRALFRLIEILIVAIVAIIWDRTYGPRLRFFRRRGF